MGGRDQRFTYDSVAAAYAEMVDSAPYNAHYERPAMLALLPPVEGRRILDAGCGSGWYADQLLQRGAEVDGIDASPAMLAYAERRLAKVAGGPAGSRVRLLHADLANRLPFDDVTFDGIVSPLALHYLRDWRPTLAEMRRVLRPEGWLLLSTHHPAADAERLATRSYRTVEHVVDHWKLIGRVEFYRRPWAEILGSLRDAGFTVENVVEPEPTERFRELEPEAWERIRRLPEFLLVLARRPMQRSTTTQELHSG